MDLLLFVHSSPEIEILDKIRYCRAFSKDPVLCENEMQNRRDLAWRRKRQSTSCFGRTPCLMVSGSWFYRITPGSIQNRNSGHLLCQHQMPNNNI